MSISEGADRKVLLKCFAGCAVDDILQSAGLSTSALFPKRNDDHRTVTVPTKERFARAIKAAPSRKIVATYDYTDGAGNLLFQVVRYDPKDFRQRRPDGAGGWINNLRGAEPVLYHLPDTERARQEGLVVFLVEGEKDADNLSGLGLVSTTAPMGAKKWRDSYSEALRGLHVVIIPDNDDPGRDHARLVAKSLGGVAESVRVVSLPNVSDKGGDVSDWLDAGGTVDELKTIVESAPELAGVVEENWPEPDRRILDDSAIDVPELDPGLLPGSMRAWVMDQTHRMGVCPEFMAVAVMSALGSVIGRQVSIAPNQADDWREFPLLWALIIGSPGRKKTPAVNAAMYPLERLEDTYRKIFIEAMNEHNGSLAEYEIDLKAAKANALKAKKGGNDAGASKALCSIGDQPSKPPHRRFMVHDATAEAYARSLKESPNGLLLHVDELVGFIKGFERAGREHERAFWLQSWSGKGRFHVKRISRDDLDVEALAASVIGTTQPGPLREYLTNLAMDGQGDGLAERFQMAVWPGDFTPPPSRERDRAPDLEARRKAVDVFFRLAEINTEDSGCETDISGNRFFRFDDDAQPLWYDWIDDLDERKREDPTLEGVLSKHDHLVLAVALIVHLADGHKGRIQRATLERAIGWSDFLIDHARKIYFATEPKAARARSLAEKIQDRALEAPFTVRDIQRRDWGGLSDVGKIQEAMDILEGAGWVRTIEPEQGKPGRPSIKYEINPAL